MKTIISYTIFSLLLLLSSQNAFSQKKQERENKKNEAFTETKTLVDSAQFIYVPNRAFPQGGQSIDLTTNYGFIKITGDNAEGDLPFFGRGFQSHYGNDGGIKFNGTMENKKVEINEKKRTITFSFEVKDKDHYRVSMEISYNGNTSVNVTSNNRSHISYQGEIDKIEEKESKK
ncbi:DUF4251 domain-containing protein [Carboxylicivirga sp. N1Y90]|uniref:DUF4251 domain-containing protein n=1 Tax=Carboxylicivirga fragile TaxID=3417571 RepID=UPI003D355A9D|nr:DUF4251 domain-containing protein [Marinilabiliaceae bacterium N1Y90]